VFRKHSAVEAISENGDGKNGRLPAQKGGHLTT
jgi:hypothetical protein